MKGTVDLALGERFVPNSFEIRDFTYLIDM